MELRAGEINIAKDTCMLHRGVLASKAEVILTNQRLVITPTGLLDRMTGSQQVTIDVDEIDMVDVRGLDSMLYIESQGEFIKLSGAGALRMKEPIEAQRTRFYTGSSKVPIQSVDPILLQGNIQIFIFRHVSSKGEFFLTAKTIRLISTGFIENLVFRPIKMEESVNSIEDIDYKRIDRKLTITFSGSKPVILSGEMAHKLYVQLVAIREGKAEGTSPLTSGMEVTLHQGMLAPAQTGHLVQSNERLLFSPSSQLDNLVGARNFSLLLSDIERLEVRGWPDKRLHIYYKNTNISFDIENPSLRLKEMKEFILMEKESNAFVDTRSQLDLNKAITFCSKYDIDAQEELPIFIDRSMEVFNKLALRFGWLLLTNKNLYFLPDENAEPWKTEIKYIGQIRLRKNDKPHLALSIKATRHHFYIKGHFQENVDFLWERINEIKPPTFLVPERNNQPLERLLGEFDIILFRKDGRFFLDAKDVELNIIETYDQHKLRIFMPKIEEHNLQQGMPLDIELAKDGGRYKMSTILTEIYLESPDPMGRYYISLEAPDDIIFYNQRSNFRISLTDTDTSKYIHDRKVIFKVFHVIKFDQSKKGDAGLILEDIWKKIGQGYAIWNDISMGGCSIVIPYNLKTHYPPQLVEKPMPEDYEGNPEDWVPTYRVFFDPEKEATLSTDELRIQVNLPMANDKTKLNLRIVRIRPIVLRNGNIEYEYGLEFVDLSRKAFNTLNQELMVLEREFLRKRRKE